MTCSSRPQLGQIRSASSNSKLLGRPELLAFLALGFRLGRAGRFVALLRFLRQRLDQGERLLQLIGRALERLELAALASENAQQLFNLQLLCESDSAELLDICLAPHVHEYF